MLDLEKLFAEKNITLSSRDLYIKNLTRLNDGQPIKNIHFLKDVGIADYWDIGAVWKGDVSNIPYHIISQS